MSNKSIIEWASKFPPDQYNLTLADFLPLMELIENTNKSAAFEWITALYNYGFERGRRCERRRSSRYKTTPSCSH